MLARRHLLIALLVPVAIGAAAVVLLPPRRIAPEHHLRAPESLPPVARALLSERMGRHGDDMGELSWYVVALEYEAAGHLAQRLAAEPTLARPVDNDATELNSALPPRFFELQDDLKARAATLARTAALRDPDALAQSYAELTRTCIACHAAYLKGR